MQQYYFANSQERFGASSIVLEIRIEREDSVLGSITWEQLALTLGTSGEDLQGFVTGKQLLFPSKMRER